MAETNGVKEAADRTDEQLWRAFVEGDAGALRPLVVRHSADLYRYLLLSTGSERTAGRHLLTTWEALVRYRGPHEGFPSFKGWLYAVATQRTVPPTQPEELGLAELLDSFTGSGGAARRAELFERVTGLARPIRQPFLLTTMVGLPGGEAAAACNFRRRRLLHSVRKACESMLRGRIGREKPPSVDCAEAAAAFAGRLLGALDADTERTLDLHLGACEACAAHFAEWEALRTGMRELAPAEFPDQVEQMLAERLEALAAATRGGGAPPASVKTDQTAVQKVLIFAGAMLVMAAIFAGLLLLSRWQYEPTPAAADVVIHAGRVETSAPGSWRWEELWRGASALPPGARLRTADDGLLKVSGDGAEWWADAGTALGVLDSRSVELVEGRLYVQCSAEGDEAARLLTRNGIVHCWRGSYVARVAGRRLRVACVSGTAFLGEGRESPALEAGQAGLIVDGQVIPPARHIRPADATHWLRRFESYDERRLTYRELAALPTDAAPVLPDTVVLERIELQALVRGPLALLLFECTLWNAGERPWEGTLTAQDVLSTAPVASTPAEFAPVPPGGRAVGRMAALCVLRAREGRFGAGLNLARWTRNTVGWLDLSVDARADGGLRRLHCPTLGQDAVGRDAGRREWHARAFDPATPLVFEFEFRKGAGLDALVLDSPDGDVALVAWRTGAERTAWPTRGASVFFVFDATADYGDAGRNYAAHVLEVLLAVVPRGTSTALLVYDGRARVDPHPLTRHLPGRVDSMLAALWEVEAEPSGDGGFLPAIAETLAGVEGPGVVLMVTGRGAPGTAEWGPGDRLAPAVIQVGTGQPHPLWRALCAGSSGTAAAFDGSEASELAALDVLHDLQWPALGGHRLELEGADGRILPVTTGSAAQPVVGLLAVSEEEVSVGVGMAATAGGRELSRQAAIGPGPDSIYAGPGAAELAGRLLLILGGPAERAAE